MACIYDRHYCPKCKTEIEVEQRQTGYFCSSCGKYYNLLDKEVDYKDVSCSSRPLSDMIDLICK